MPSEVTPYGHKTQLELAVDYEAATLVGAATVAVIMLLPNMKRYIRIKHHVR